MNWLVSLSKKVCATEILELVDCLFGDLPYIRNKLLDSNAVRSLSFSKAPEDIFQEKAGLRVHTSDVPPAVLSDQLCGLVLSWLFRPSRIHKQNERFVPNDSQNPFQV